MSEATPRPAGRSLAAARAGVPERADRDHMAILERNAVAHYGVQRNGGTRPLCLSWRSTWNWTRAPAEVTCPQCKAALATRGEQPKVARGDGPER